MAQVPVFSLSHGNTKLPAIGLGTFKSKGDQVGKVVIQAIEMGYRMLDCASDYLNEDKIGDALEEVFKSGKVKREDLFITSKLNNNYHRPEHVRPILEKTLLDLKLDYLDLFLVHWPVATTYVPYPQNTRGFPPSYDPSGKDVVIEKVPLQDTWKEMEKLQTQGLVKSIGVSNWTVALLSDTLSYATIKPAVNQVELHPYLQQSELVAYCKKHDIVVQAYSPLGTVDFKKEHEPTILEDNTIKAIAKKHNKTPAQICLRWGTQRGTCVIPKTVTQERLKENLHTFDFTLDQTDMDQIASLNRNYRFFRPEEWWDVPLFS